MPNLRQPPAPRRLHNGNPQRIKLFSNEALEQPGIVRLSELLCGAEYPEDHLSEKPDQVRQDLSRFHE
jgi:hypothetical protein